MGAVLAGIGAIRTLAIRPRKVDRDAVEHLGDGAGSVVGHHQDADPFRVHHGRSPGSSSTVAAVEVQRVGEGGPLGVEEGDVTDGCRVVLNDHALSSRGLSHLRAERVAVLDVRVPFADRQEAVGGWCRQGNALDMELYDYACRLHEERHAGARP